MDWQRQKYQTCLPVRTRPSWQPMLSHALGRSHLQHPIGPCQIIRWTSKNPTLLPQESSLNPENPLFCILLMCDSPLNSHLQLDKSLSNHSAQTLVELPCLLLWAPGWNYLQWVRSTENHPSIDLLSGRLWERPLFQSERGCCPHLFQQLIINFVWWVVF